MTVKGRIDIGGTRYYDAENITVEDNTGDNNSTSTFTASFLNHNGLHNTDFDINDTVSIYAIGVATTKVFEGTIQNIKTFGRGQFETITLTGQNKMSILIDTTVEPVIYTSQEVSVIVASLISDVTGITATNVDVTGTTLDRIAFNHTSVFDALQELATLADFYFYVDISSDLHFKQKGGITSGYTLDNTNVLKAKFTESDSQMANRIWVYGDRLLTAVPTQWLIADGGSKYSLSYKPHNTKVTVAGSIQKGGVYNISASDPSGTEYLVNYDSSQIIFVSGATAGNHIPSSGGSFAVEYERAQPIIKYADDPASVTLYGNKDKIIINKEITDPSYARDIARAEAKKNNVPIVEGYLNLADFETLTAGDTVVVNLANHDVVNTTFNILNVTYTFNTSTSYSGRVVEVTVSRRKKDLIDTLKQIVNDIKQIKSGDSSASDYLTRLKSSIEQNTIRRTRYKLTKTDYSGAAGSVFLYADPTNGQIGNSMWTVAATYTPGSSVVVVNNYDNTFVEKFYTTNFIDTGSTTATVDTANGQVIF